MRKLLTFALTKLVGKEHIYDSLPDVLDAYYPMGAKRVGTGPGVSEKVVCNVKNWIC
jgi:hypothetical protein